MIIPEEIFEAVKIWAEWEEREIQPDDGHSSGPAPVAY